MVKTIVFVSIIINVVYKVQFCTFLIYNVKRRPTTIVVKRGDCLWQLQCLVIIIIIIIIIIFLCKRSLSDKHGTYAGMDPW